MSSPRPLSPAVLIELLACSFEPWGSSNWYPSTPPTPRSVAHIRDQLGIALPPLFVQAAAACPSYGGWFGSIGEDYASHNHILQLNATFRPEGLPGHYVMLNHGHDGDCDCWDTSATPSGGEFPILYASLSDTGQISRVRPLAVNFRDYLEALCRTHAPRCPVKRLRRRAKRLLAAMDHPPGDDSASR